MELVKTLLYLGTPWALAAGTLRGLFKKEWLLFGMSYIMFHVFIFAWW